MHVDLEEVYAALRPLCNGRGTLSEAVPLATCARLEVYGVAPDGKRALGVLRRLMAQRKGISRDELDRHVYVSRGADAARHLLRVAAGLDSVVHGEAQVLGQVRDAAHHPLVATTEGPVLHRLFQHALTAGKRVRSETEIGRGAASLASASVAMLQREVGELELVTALVLGAGDTGALMARLLVKAGVGRLIIANRTLERAADVARDLGAEVRGLDSVCEVLPDVEVIVGAVVTRDPIVTPDMVRDASTPTTRRYFLDLAHPRNFDPALADLPGVTIFDLEHVFRRVEAARRARSAHIPRAEAIVAEEAEAFQRWRRSRASVALVKAVRAQVLDRAMAEADRYTAKAPEEQREQMRHLARSVARALLHGPTVALRDADPASEAGRALLSHASTLFGIEEPVDDNAK